MSKIHPVFKDTIGQTNAVQRLSQSIYSAKNGGEMLSPLLSQEAGGGKTHLGSRYLKGLAETGVNTLFYNSPEEFRLPGAHFDNIVNLITSGERYALFFDECHLFHNRKTVQLEKVWAFIMKALDKNNQNRTFNFDGQTTVNFKRDQGCIVLATNYPMHLDKSGAFQSRCDRIELSPYSEDELVQILQVMLKETGFQEANEETLLRIARCGRGTARPMEKIIDQITMMRSASGEKRNSINREDVLEALRLCKMYPRGLKEDEIRLLNICKTPLRDSVISAFLPQMERPAIRNSKGFLMSQGFATQTSQGFQITTNGTNYLAQAKKEKFPVDFNR